jgi:hypothetical protein
MGYNLAMSGSNDERFAVVYSESRAYMRRERSDHNLQAAALVHEARMRLAGSEPARNRPYFPVITAHTKRRLLLDYARQGNAGNAELVEPRFFGRLNVNESADAGDTSGATLKRESRLAKAWLHRELASVNSG